MASIDVSGADSPSLSGGGGEDDSSRCSSVIDISNRDGGCKKGKTAAGPSGGVSSPQAGSNKVLGRRSSLDTITNYNNAVPGAPRSTDRISAPGSFADFVANNPGDHHVSLSLDGSMHSVDDDKPAADFKNLMTQYEGLYNYVHGGRQELINEIAGAENSYAAVERSLQYYAPSERHNVTMVLNAYAEKIEEMKNRVKGFDDDIPVTRARIQAELYAGLSVLPGELVMNLVQECQWPNENV